MANSLKLRPAHNDFQEKLKEDITQIKSSIDVFIFAEEQQSPEEYKKLLFNNITKPYRIFTEHLLIAIDMEAKYISKKLQLDNRTECFAKYSYVYIVKRP